MIIDNIIVFFFEGGGAHKYIDLLTSKLGCR